jgi:hypothetical protein
LAKKNKQKQGSKKFLVGWKKKLSLVSFGQGVGYWLLARVCFFCAFAYFLSAG